MLTVTQVAQRLGVCLSTTYAIIARGDLPAHRIGAAIRVSEADLAAYIARCRERQAVTRG